MLDRSFVIPPLARVLFFTVCLVNPIFGCGDLEDRTAAGEGSGNDALSGAVEIGSALVTTANVNLREGPSTSAQIIRALGKGTVVTAIARSRPSGAFYNVRAESDDGWVHGAYLAHAPDAQDASARDGAPQQGEPTCTAGRADGACRIYAASGGKSAQNPAYSPDGSRILFTIWKGGYNEAPAALATLPVAGGSATTIVDNGASNVNLPGTSWNAATNRIVFASDVNDGPDEIYASNPDGSGMKRVTHHTNSAIYQEPSFSPDGTKIVFEASYGENSAEIWTVNADGSGARRITQGSIDRQPNWSPTGDRILFQRLTSDWALYTITPDGANVKRITPVADSSTDAAWSPDGKKIVYSSARGDLAGANLFVVDVGAIGATPGTPVRVTHYSGYDGAVSWSPDGKWLAFESSSNPDGESITSLWRIRLPE
jgi:TolB protein